jgi:hypothetical protein
MTKEQPENRPTCKEILEAKHLWVLHENEFEFVNDCQNVLNSRNMDKIPFIYYLLEQKLIKYSNEGKADEKKERNLFFIKNLLTYKRRPAIVEHYLFCLYDSTLTYSEPSNDSIELLTVLMREHSKVAEIQLYAIKCLYNYTEKDKWEEKVSSKILGNAVEMTLISMELFPKNIEIHYYALLFICSWNLVQKISFDRYKCIQLVMNSLINLRDIHLNPRAFLICSTCLYVLKIRKAKNLNLCTNSVYIQMILDVIKNYIESTPNDEFMVTTTLTTLFYLTYDFMSKINPQLIENMIGIILELMVSFPNNRDIQYYALLILKDDHILQKSLFDRSKCIKLVLDSLVKFMDTILNEDSLAICLKLIRNISIDEKINLFSNPVYLEKLLTLVNNNLNKELKKYSEMLLRGIGIKAIESIHKLSQTSNDHFLQRISKQTLDHIEKNTFLLSGLRNECRIV